MIRIYSKLPRDIRAGLNGEVFTIKGGDITEVPEALGRAWLQQYAHSGPVQDGLIGIERTRRTRKAAK